MNKFLQIAGMARLILPNALWIAQDSTGVWNAHVKKPILIKGNWSVPPPYTKLGKISFIMNDEPPLDTSTQCFSIVDIIFTSKEERLKYLTNVTKTIIPSANYLVQNADGVWNAFEIKPQIGLNVNDEKRWWIESDYSMSRAHFISHTSPPDDMKNEFYVITKDNWNL